MKTFKQFLKESNINLGSDLQYLQLLKNSPITSRLERLYNYINASHYVPAEYMNLLTDTDYEKADQYIKSKGKKIVQGALKEDVAPTDEVGNAKAAIIDLFRNNEKIDDSMIHSLSDKLGIDTHVFEGYVYGLLSSFLHAGKSMNFNGSFDQNQIEMGKKVEMEHTTDPAIAERIAKDHLSEIPDYYTRLAKMESEAK